MAALELCLAGQSEIQDFFQFLLINFRPNRTGCAIKNRWNWMMSGKRKNVFEKVVMNNPDLFRRVFQALHRDRSEILTFD